MNLCPKCKGRLFHSQIESSYECLNTHCGYEEFEKDIISLEKGDTGTLYDANGDLVDKLSVEANLQTGRVKCQKDTQGRAVEWEDIYFDAPLKFERNATVET